MIVFMAEGPFGVMGIIVHYHFIAHIHTITSLSSCNALLLDFNTSKNAGTSENSHIRTQIQEQTHKHTQVNKHPDHTHISCRLMVHASDILRQQ